MTDRLTCILCPLGCELEAERARDGLEVRGNQCEKGIGFAEEEILHPIRNLATSVPLRGTVSQMVSVRLSGPVPRDKIFPILSEIAGLRPERPVRRGRVLIPNVLGTGADVIATRTVKGNAPSPSSRRNWATPPASSGRPSSPFAKWGSWNSSETVFA